MNIISDIYNSIASVFGSEEAERSERSDYRLTRADKKELEELIELYTSDMNGRYQIYDNCIEEKYKNNVAISFLEQINRNPLFANNADNVEYVVQMLDNLCRQLSDFFQMESQRLKKTAQPDLASATKQRQRDDNVREQADFVVLSNEGNRADRLKPAAAQVATERRRRKMLNEIRQLVEARKQTTPSPLKNSFDELDFTVSFSDDEETMTDSFGEKM